MVIKESHCLCFVLQDQNSLSSSFFLSFSSVCGTDVQEMHGRPRSWAYQLKELALWIVERRKSGLPVPRSLEILLTGKMLINSYCLRFVTMKVWSTQCICFRGQNLYLIFVSFFPVEMPLLFGAIAAVLVMHPSIGSTSIDALASIGNMDPKLGVSLLLSILFYNNIFTRKDVVYQSMLVRVPITSPNIVSTLVLCY